MRQEKNKQKIQNKIETIINKISVNDPVPETYMGILFGDSLLGEQNPEDQDSITGIAPTNEMKDLLNILVFQDKQDLG